MNYDYPTNLDVRPISTWPGEFTKAHLRKRSPFSAPMRSTIATLTTELFQLGARAPVMEVAIAADQFRVDGKPRATARADHPGVVLSLPHTDVGPLRYATDRFETWQDNLRAIALGLEALRKVERYGITRRGEQYVGFKALPSGAGPMTRTAAEEFIRANGGSYREAAKRLHPDAGGFTEGFQRLEEAVRTLRATS